MKNQQTTPYPIQMLLIAALSCYGLVALARGGEKASIPGAATLTVDRDTVLGTPRGVLGSKFYMAPHYGVVVRNNSGNPVTVDSIRIRPDSAVSGGLLELSFIVDSKTYPAPLEVFTSYFHSRDPREVFPAFRIPAHDSVIIGRILIGPATYLVKQSANSKRYQEGDSITTPVVLIAGKDSVTFILKARVQDPILVGSGILRKASVRMRSPNRASFGLDGRSLDGGTRSRSGGKINSAVAGKSGIR